MLARLVLNFPSCMPIEVVPRFTSVPCLAHTKPPSFFFVILILLISAEQLKACKLDWVAGLGKSAFGPGHTQEQLL
jgi:hypothetical protein